MTRIERIVVYTWPEAERILREEGTRLQCWPYDITRPARFVILRNVEV